MAQAEEQGCLEARIQLLIYPGNISPDKITDIIGIEPTETAVKGTISGPNSVGKVHINPCTLWFLISDQIVKSSSVAVHLDWMLDKLLMAKPGLDKIKALPGVTIYFRFTWWTKTGGCFNFRPDQLKKLAELDLELEFDIAAYPDEQDSEE